MWQTKYALTVPKNLGLGLDFCRAVKAIFSPGVCSLCMNLLNAPPEMILTQHNVRRGADKQTK